MKQNSAFKRIKHSIEILEIGDCYPQIQNLPVNYDLNKDDSIYNFDFVSFPNISPNLNSLPLDNNGKLTDLLSCSYLTNGLLISRKFAILLNSFRLPENRFFQATIRKSNKLLPYFWFFFISDLSELIDFRISKFYIGRTIKTYSQIYEFENKVQFYIKREELIRKRQLLKPMKIQLKDEVPFDVFTILSYDINNIYISDDLAESIKKNRISGLEILSSKIWI